KIAFAEEYQRIRCYRSQPRLSKGLRAGLGLRPCTRSRIGHAGMTGRASRTRLGRCTMGCPRLRVVVGLGFLILSSPLSAQQPRATLHGHTEQVLCVAFSPDGKTLASGGADNTIRFWEVATGKELATLEKAAEFWV